MSSSFAAMTPFCGQYAPLTASAKWSQKTFATLLSSSACASCHLADAKLVTLAWHLPGFTLGQAMLPKCWALWGETLLSIVLHSDYYIIIVNNFFVSNRIIGFLGSTHLKCNYFGIRLGLKCWKEDYTFAGQVFSIAKNLPKIYQIGHLVKTNFSQDCIVLRIKLN